MTERSPSIYITSFPNFVKRNEDLETLSDKSLGNKTGRHQNRIKTAELNSFKHPIKLSQANWRAIAKRESTTAFVWTIEFKKFSTMRIRPTEFTQSTMQASCEDVHP